ncbi:hypothetical protein [Streptomyces sp. NBC_01367]|uniref:hypothetical protein n=1 Tax=Streptomyces sp. NBC_01367 TaxID=2903841 RepID=UPI003243E212
MTSPTKIRRMIAPTLLVAAAALLAPQCSPSLIDDAGRSVGRVVDDLDIRPDGTRVLTTSTGEIVIPPQADVFTTETNRSIRAIAANSLSGLNMDDARMVVARGCALKDGAEALDKEELVEAARSALISYGGNHTLKVRVAELAQSMAATERAEAAVGQFAVFALCETA